MTYYYVDTRDTVNGRKIYELGHNGEININVSRFVDDRKKVIEIIYKYQVKKDTGYVRQFDMTDRKTTIEKIYELNDIETFVFFIQDHGNFYGNVVLNKLLNWAADNDFMALFRMICLDVFDRLPSASCLDYVIKNNYEPYIQFLLEIGVKHDSNTIYLSVVHNEKLAKTFIDSCQDQYVLNHALCIATQHNKKNIIEYLIDSGADVSNYDNYNPIKYIMRHNDLSMIKYLFNKIDLSKFLLNLKAQLDIFQKAVDKQCDYEIFIYLIEIGLDINHFPTIISKLLHQPGTVKTFKFLFEYIDNKSDIVDLFLLEAARYNRSNLIQYFMDYGADISYQNYACLFWIIMHDSIETIKNLLQLNIIEIDIANSILISTAVHHGYFTMVKFLVEYQANLDFKYINGDTLYSRAVKNENYKIASNEKITSYEKIASYLKNAGAPLE